MLKKFLTVLVFFVLAFSLIAISSSIYIVEEGRMAIITQFGKVVGSPVLEPGLHFKTPFIQKVNYFEKRVLEWDGDPNQVPTKDKRFIWVDTFARWEISNPILFFQRVRDERSAKTRLDDILDGEVRNVIANHNLVEVIRTTNRKMIFSDITDMPTQNTNIKVGRGKIAKLIKQSASPKLAELGIKLLDIRIKRVNYVKEVQRKIEDRMIAERKRIADRFRAEGRGKSAEILGKKERELRKIRSEAYRTAQEIRGKADAEAAAIYAKAYNQSKEAREFYDFLKTMETYKNIITKENRIILSTESELFKYLK